jgi:hypothetical protein
MNRHNTINELFDIEFRHIEQKIDPTKYVESTGFRDEENLFFASQESLPSIFHLGRTFIKNLLKELHEKCNLRICHVEYDDTRFSEEEKLDVNLIHPKIIKCLIDVDDAENIVLLLENMGRVKTNKNIRKHVASNNFAYFSNAVRLMYRGTYNGAFINKIHDIFVENKVESRYLHGDKAYIEMIVASNNGLDLRQIELNFKPMSKKQLELHYGDDFVDFDASLRKKMLSQPKGIVLFHGPPGNGKSFYIKNLIVQLVKGKKRIVLIPKNTIDQLDSPSFTDFLLDSLSSSETVFIIEDAEALLSSREGGNNPILSTLLNMSDGILNDIFNVQILCTFNTDLENIDKAVLRKKRLISNKLFADLSKENAQRLINHLKVDFVAKDSMSVAEIYALLDEDEELLLDLKKRNKKQEIGFVKRNK